MEIQTLKYFLLIAKLGSLRQASDAGNLTPSAMSRQISLLEHSLGAKLFERRASGMALTAEGRAFVKYASRTVRDIDLATQEIDEIRGLRRGHVTISTVEGAVTGLVYPMIELYRRSHPEVTFDVVATGTGGVHASVESDDAEIGIAYNPAQDRDVRVVMELCRPTVLLCSPKSALRYMKNVSLRDLEDVPLGLLDHSFGTRRLIEEAVRAEDIRLSCDVTVNSVEMAKAYAKANLGATILPAFAASQECAAGILCQVPLTEVIFQRALLSVCVRSGRELSRAADAFLDLLVRNADRLLWSERPVFENRQQHVREVAAP